jgi:hypothetical protein
MPRSLAAGLFLLCAACTVPEHMHVTEGAAPQHVDTDVRFRVNYYFRVFDYCWSADSVLALQSTDKKSTGAAYRQIIPETDTLYRYRMTGKSSALFNKVKFESGTLKKEQIDPFGTDVTFNRDIGGFLVRNEGEAKAEARALADSRARKEAGAADDLRQAARRAGGCDKGPVSENTRGSRGGDDAVAGALHGRRRGADPR